jgi:peptidylprolyl isomerase
MRLFLKAALFAIAALTSVDASANPSDNVVTLHVSTGPVVIELKPELAPAHVQRMRTLVQSGFYDGTPFHRVVPGFMAQGGDPTGTGTGGSGTKIPAEFSQAPFHRGTVAMARSSEPDSADSQFFIMYQPNANLVGKYTVFGEVVSGMEFVDALPGGSGKEGRVVNPGIVMKADIGKTEGRFQTVLAQYTDKKKKEDARRAEEERAQRVAKEKEEKQRKARHAAEQKRRMQALDVGDYVCSWRYGTGSGWCGTVEDVRASKLRIEVQTVEVNGFMSTRLNASDCSGNKNLAYNDSGVLIWVPKSCVDEVR